MGTSRSRTPDKLQYDPRVHILQHGHDVNYAKYGKLARLVTTEMVSSRKTSSLSQVTQFTREWVATCNDGADHEAVCAVGQPERWEGGLCSRHLHNPRRAVQVFELC